MASRPPHPGERLSDGKKPSAVVDMTHLEPPLWEGGTGEFTTVGPFGGGGIPVERTISLTEDQLIYLGAMSLYAGRPHSHVHAEKIGQMHTAVDDARLMWEVLRARRPNEGDVPEPRADVAVP